jgi:dishevelled associated activator of morphogenesis
LSLSSTRQNDEPPEICVVEGVLSLENLTPTQPMPSTEELEEKFAELVEELDLTECQEVADLLQPEDPRRG